MFDLVVIGHISFDENIIRGERHVIKSGSAYLVGLPASLFSKKVGIVSRIGKDFPFKDLQKLKVDISGIKIIKNGKTTRFFHTYLSEDGQERTFRAEMNVGKDMITKDIPTKYLKAHFIHVATNLPQKQIEFVKFIRRKSQALISIDSLEQYIEQYPKEVLEVFKLVDIVFIDKKEKELIRKLSGKAMVIKKGAGGADYIEDGKTVSVKVLEVKSVIDKTGAGDVLAGTFLVLMARGKNPKFALQQAVNLASKSITQHGINFLLDEIT